ncbi:MAG TPA: hypothetical protein VIV57_12565 [Anaeromyxobacter sp.]
MRRAVKVLVFQNRFRLGGQERQTVMNVRTMQRTRFDPVVACLHLDGEHLADLAAAGVRPVVFDVGGSMFRANTGLQLVRLVRFIRAHRIALVHVRRRLRGRRRRGLPGRAPVRGAGRPGRPRRPPC